MCHGSAIQVNDMLIMLNMSLSMFPLAFNMAHLHLTWGKKKRGEACSSWLSHTNTGPMASGNERATQTGKDIRVCSVCSTFCHHRANFTFYINYSFIYLFETGMIIQVGYPSKLPFLWLHSVSFFQLLLYDDSVLGAMSDVVKLMFYRNLVLR